MPLAWQQLKNSKTGFGSWQLWLAILLMPLNWMLETYKWYVLVNKFQALSFLKSFEAVLSGLALSLNTPNRIGEYGGRILYLKPDFRLRGIALTILCSVSQVLITLVCGLLALLALKPELHKVHFSETTLTGVFFNVLVYGVLLMTLVTGLFYFKMQWLVKVLKWIPFVKEKFSFAFVLEHLRGKVMWKILFYSFLRFIVFALQYVLVWRALGVDINWWDGFWCISLVFLIMAIVPSFAIAEIGIRGKVALGIVGLFSVNTIAILTGTIGMWILNLVFPALIGSLFLLTIKIFKEK